MYVCEVCVCVCVCDVNVRACVCVLHSLMYATHLSVFV